MSMEKAKEIATFLKDVLTILGIPSLIWIGKDLYDIQNKALESQIKSLEAQNSFLKETQYDRALALIKSQRELNEMNLKELESKVANKDLQLAEKNELLRQVEVEKEQARKADEAFRELYAAGKWFGYNVDPDNPGAYSKKFSTLGLKPIAPFSPQK